MSRTLQKKLKAVYLGMPRILQVAGNATESTEKHDSFIHQFFGDDDGFYFSDSNVSDYFRINDVQGFTDQMVLLGHIITKQENGPAFIQL